MSLDARRTGEGLGAACADLARVWRSARAVERPDAFPGLLDGLIEPFFTHAAEALADGRHPALLWPSLTGVVRLDARDPRRAREELEAEWDLVARIVEAACQALDADADAREWMSRALAIGRAGTRRLPDREGAPGILTVRVFSDLAAMRRGRGHGRR